MAVVAGGNTGVHWEERRVGRLELGSCAPSVCHMQISIVAFVFKFGGLWLPALSVGSPSPFPRNESTTVPRMASRVGVVAASSASSKTTTANLRKLMSPQVLSKTLAGLRVRPASDYVHQWVPVPGVATAKKGSALSLSSPSQPAAPSILTVTGERTRMRWQQSRVSARVLADVRKKVARLESAGITLTHPESGAPISGARLLNLPPPKPLSTKTVRMGKPDKGRKHDRTAPLR